MLPNFLIIGATKSGTTSLYYYLKQHPQIYMSPIKEPKFFAYPINDNWTITQAPEVPWLLANPSCGISDLKSYEALFAETKDEIVRGEASVIYLYSYFAPTQIHKCIPHVKLIAILRHPAERAYSNFLHTIREQQEIYHSFPLALTHELERIKNGDRPVFFYQYKGLYYRYLTRYFELFDPQQIKIYLYEDFQYHPQEMLKSIFDFLDVDNSFIPDMSIRYQMTGIPKNSLLQQMIKISKPLRRIIRPLFSENWRNSLFFSVQNSNLQKPTMDLETRDKLINYYREDIFKLQELINRDLSHWLK